MKKPFILAAIFLMMMTGFNSSSTAEENPNIISATGTATISAEPDTTIFSLAVETENKMLSLALKENTDKARKVVAEVKKVIGKDDTIKTTGFNVSPIYNYDNKERKSILTGYRVTNSINVKTKKISEAGKIIDAAIQAGANKTDNLDFIVENKDKYFSELLKQASNQAKQKATITATALGVKITGINRINTNFAEETVSPYYRNSFAGLELKSTAAGVAPPIEAGEVNLKAVVSVDFFIENSK